MPETATGPAATDGAGDGGREGEMQQVGRTEDGHVEAPERYVEYAGQVIVRTRNGTHQRWKKSGWHLRDVDEPYILGREECQDRGRTDPDPMNPELGPTEFSVYYVADEETIRYEVVE